MMDRVLKLDQVTTLREILLNALVDVVGKGLQDALLECGLYHVF